MFTEHLKTVMTRELRALARELQAYPDDASVWRTFPGVGNSAGTLALHLAGNVQHYVGAKLGGTGYQRDRPAEFARRDVPRGELLREIERAIAAAETTLPQVSETALAADFPEAVGGRIIRTDEFLLHVATHLGWHLGQVDYHRRMVTGEAGKIGAVAVTELATARTG
ncbi:MAG TPA: DinB family protein [Gemmatimonadales bacterium]|nr:DinB family protein [Gemmatimonadales bacterium]